MHQQVRFAQAEYADLIASGQLYVVGAVYDFRNDLGKGAGRLHILNINGERRPEKFATLPVFAEAQKRWTALRAGRDAGTPTSAAQPAAKHP